jgi:hypothetical protein
MALLTRAGAAALALFALGPAAASRGEQPVGQVAMAAPQVEGIQNGRRDKLQARSPVFENMGIQTFARAGARILINTDLPARKGAILLGPETEIELLERSLTMARSLKRLRLLVQLGQFRLALLPREADALPGEGECLIFTPAGDQIQLSGTDVAVQVARDGTLTIWVIEGEVEVKAAAGGVRRVSAGHRTRVRPGREPEPPVPFVAVAGPAPGPPIPPGERIFPDPPHLDLRELRLDLPQ